ncbi:MAG: ABC transporter substrate-binding protein [Candidimonas sp.]|nr:MAG: ABC transporter substrate-binding protein [Candidimonas sp.]
MKYPQAWCVATLLAISTAAIAQPAGISGGVVKIGVLTDMSGFLSDATGEGAVTAVRMAVADFGGKVLGKPIEVVAADNLNKADVAANQARTWFDTQQVDMVIDLGNSATGLSTAQVATQKNRIAIATTPGTTRLTNENCGPSTIHYAYDTYALANGIVKALVKDGHNSWYFVTIDFAGGHSIEKDASDMVKASGGKVLGAARHPIDANDFSSYILQAQASKAKVVGFATAGQAAINAIKSAGEFGLGKSQVLAGLYVFISDVHSLGLNVAQNMYVTTGFYWDQNEESRKWARRYFEKMKRMPSMIQAADYSATMHYLKAVQAAGTDDTAAVMKKMKEMPINDFFAKNGKIREDGLMVHDMYLAQVKKPAESKYPWDYYTIKAVIPAEQAFQPLSKSICARLGK